MFELCYSVQAEDKKSEVRKDAMGVYTIAYFVNNAFTHSTRSYVQEEAESLADRFVGQGKPSFLSE
jgi:hypothetical protein